MTSKVIIGPKDWTPNQYKQLRDIEFWVNFLLDKPLEILSGEVTYNAPNIPNGTFHQFDTTISGVKAGQPVFLGLPNTDSGGGGLAGSGFIWTPWTRVDTLRINLMNLSGFAVNLNNVTFRYMIFNVFPNVSVGA